LSPPQCTAQEPRAQTKLTGCTEENGLNGIDADVDESPYKLDRQDQEDKNVTTDPADIIWTILSLQQIGPVRWRATVAQAEDLDNLNGIIVPTVLPMSCQKRRKTSMM
jgi:hypothetical protein